MKGVRVEWDGQSILNEGEYAKAPSGTWYAMCPGNHLANLKGHSIIEHEDGTITASPSKTSRVVARISGKRNLETMLKKGGVK